jgi:hypothetical protein
MVFYTAGARCALSHQSAQPRVRPFEQPLPRLAIPLVQSVEQTLKLNAAALNHAGISENGPDPVRTDHLTCSAS